MRSGRSIGGVATALAVLFAADAARSDPREGRDLEPPRFHLVYEAPPGCPDRAAFIAAIHTQTPRPRVAAEGESAIAFSVMLEAGDGHASGSLDVRDPDGARERRNVSSRTCGEVAKALALVAALILDPEARTDSSEVPPTATPPGILPAPLPSPPATGSAAPPRARPVETPSSRGVRRHPWLLSAGIELGVLGGIGPSLAPMGGVLVDGELAPRGTRFVARLLTPSARVTVDVAATSSDLAVGRQSYQWLGSSLRLCPVHVPLPAGLRLAPCGAVQLAIHRGSTLDVPEPTRSLNLRIAPFAGGSLEWAVSSSVALELHGGALFPLRRSRFFLAPDITLFDMPQVAGTAALGLRVRFL